MPKFLLYVQDGNNKRISTEVMFQKCKQVIYMLWCSSYFDQLNQMKNHVHLLKSIVHKKFCDIVSCYFLNLKCLHIF